MLNQNLSLHSHLAKIIASALLALAGTLLSVSALALSGNAQVALAGAGKFDELAKGLEEMVGKEPMKAADWHALCWSYSKIKRYAKINSCLDELDKAMATRDKRTRLFGLDDGTATAYIMRAEVQVELGEYASALAQTEKAIDWYKKDGSSAKDIYINALAAKALATLALGNKEGAQRIASELDQFALGLLDRDFIPVKSLAVARVSMALGQWQKVINALAEDKTIGLRSFLDNLATGAFLRGVNNWVWIELPRGFMQTKAFLELGKIAEAKAGYDRLLAVPQVVANGEIYWLALSDRARIAELDKQLDVAEQLYLKAVQVIERQRRSINSEANKIGFVGNKQAVYARLVAVQFAQNKHAQAFESMERGKSRALVDMLATRSAESLSVKGGAQSSQILSALGTLQQSEWAALSQDEAAIARAAQPNAQTTLRSKEVTDLLPKSLASLVSVSGMDASEAQSIITQDEALLVFFGDSNQLFATLVQRSGVHGAVINARTLDADIRAVRAGLQKRDPQVQTQLQALYQTLIGPLLPKLNASKLTIVPNGALHYLPFAALNDGKRDLVDQFSLRVLPSVSTLKYLRQVTTNKVQRMLVLGNPDLNNPAYDLPGAQVEAEKLAEQYKAQRLLLRKQATREGFQTYAPQAAFIHIASHGQFNADQPMQSGLILSSQKADASIDAGRLTVADLYQLKLDAELVTLSACETGLGKVVNGDDVVGLTRGFLYAGASTVVASLWQVDDEATAFLMLRMYHHIETTGRTDALRKAQIETRAKYPHPFFWASFYLTGSN